MLLKRRTIPIKPFRGYTIYDGKKSYTINSEDEEVTITNANDEEEGLLHLLKCLLFIKKVILMYGIKNYQLKGVLFNM